MCVWESDDSCDIIAVNEHLNSTFAHNQYKKKSHSGTFIGMNENLHSPPKSQNLTTIYITLMGVPIMLRGQVEEQVINQNRAFRLPGLQRSSHNKKRKSKTRTTRGHTLPEEPQLGNIAT